MCMYTVCRAVHTQGASGDEPPPHLNKSQPGKARPAPGQLPHDATVQVRPLPLPLAGPQQAGEAACGSRLDSSSACSVQTVRSVSAQPQHSRTMPAAGCALDAVINQGWHKLCPCVPARCSGSMLLTVEQQAKSIGSPGLCQHVRAQQVGQVRQRRGHVLLAAPVVCDVALQGQQPLVDV